MLLLLLLLLAVGPRLELVAGGALGRANGTSLGQLDGRFGRARARQVGRAAESLMGRLPLVLLLLGGGCCSRGRRRHGRELLLHKVLENGRLRIGGARRAGCNRRLLLLLLLLVVGLQEVRKVRLAAGHRHLLAHLEAAWRLRGRGRAQAVSLARLLLLLEQQVQLAHHQPRLLALQAFGPARALLGRLVGCTRGPWGRRRGHLLVLCVRKVAVLLRRRRRRRCMLLVLLLAGQGATCHVIGLAGRVEAMLGRRRQRRWSAVLLGGGGGEQEVREAGRRRSGRREGTLAVGANEILHGLAVGAVAVWSVSVLVLFLAHQMARKQSGLCERFKRGFGRLTTGLRACLAPIVWAHSNQNTGQEKEKEKERAFWSEPTRRGRNYSATSSQPAIATICRLAASSCVAP